MQVGDDITPEQAVRMLEWQTLKAFVRLRLMRFCMTDDTPTREQLIETMRDVFHRMGWSLFNVGDPTEWGAYLDCVLLLAQEPWDREPVLTPGSLHHKYVACCAVLGWVDAPWALEPAPWYYEQPHWPGVWPDPPPKVTRPTGWPAVWEGGQW